MELRRKIGVIYHTLYSKVAPRRHANKIFKSFFKRDINWEHPTDLNEWINVLKFSANQDEWTLGADKYAVRGLVQEKGLGHMLVNLYGVWDNADNIDFSQLPNKFIIKSNHGSGTVEIVKDKRLINCENIRTKCRQWLKTVIGYYGVELHYTKIPRKIIAEELLDATKQSIPSSSMIDYKIWCFNGEPYCIYVIVNRIKGSFQQSCYDVNWNNRDDMLAYDEHHRKMNVEVPKPKSFEAMLEAARKLSAGHPQLRVDFYEVSEKPYFGELTFTSNGGYMQYFTQDALREMGQQIHR